MRDNGKTTHGYTGTPTYAAWLGMRSPGRIFGFERSRRCAEPERVAAMYAMYTGGASLAQVGEKFDITRQAVYDIFKTRKLPLRAKTFLPFVEFAGLKYTINSKGYYRCTVGRIRTRFLHQEVWKAINGPIPDGFDVHHRDDDKTNNDISNLACLPKAEHTRLYSPHNNQYTRGQKRREFVHKNCLACGLALVPHRDLERKESPSAFARRRFCGSACKGVFSQGKKRGGAVCE